jgi:hypothetical protein
VLDDVVIELAATVCALVLPFSLAFLAVLHALRGFQDMDVQWLLELFCPICEEPFYLHLSCFRGDKYCCRECAVEARKRKQKVNKKKYESTLKAKQLSAKRQSRRRERRKTVKAQAHVTQQGSSDLEAVSEIVAVRPGGLARNSENLDARVVAGDHAGPAVHAGGLDEPGGQERAPTERATGAVVWWTDPRCARCGEPGRLLLHAPLAGGP